MRPIVLVVNVVLIVVGIILAIMGAMYSSPGAELGAAIMLLLTVGYLANSFHRVDLGNQAAITFGGKPIENVESGWTYVPPILFTLEELPTQFFTILFGTLEDNKATGHVYHDRSLRITFSGAKKSESKEEKDTGKKNSKGAKVETEGPGGEMNPLVSLMTTDPTVVIVMRILPGHASTFIKAVESIPNALQQLKHVTEGFLQGVVAPKTVEEARLKTVQVSDQLRKEIEKLVKEGTPTIEGAWGVEIASCRVTSWGIPRRVNEALAEVAKSIADANKAEFERITGFKQAAVEAEKLRLKGLAEGDVAKRKEELAKSPEGKFVLMLETLNEMMHDVAQGKNTTLLTTAGDMGIENMLAKLLAMQSRLKFTEGKEETEPKKLT